MDFLEKISVENTAENNASPAGLYLFIHFNAQVKYKNKPKQNGRHCQVIQIDGRWHD